MFQALGGAWRGLLGFGLFDAVVEAGLFSCGVVFVIHAFALGHVYFGDRGLQGLIDLFRVASLDGGIDPLDVGLDAGPCGDVALAPFFVGQIALFL